MAKLGGAAALLITLVWTAACSSASDGQDTGTTAAQRESTTIAADPSAASDDAAYERALMTRFEAIEDEDPALDGIEQCAASAVIKVVDAQMWSAAGITPEEAAGGEIFEEDELASKVSTSIGDALRECDLAQAVADQLRSINPAFVSEVDALCVGTAMSNDQAYRAQLGRWTVEPIVDDWDTYVEGSFNRAMIACPEAYVTIMIGGIEHQNGALPAVGKACLIDGLRAEVSGLVSEYEETARDALERAAGPCLGDLGEFGEALRAELEN